MQQTLPSGQRPVGQRGRGVAGDDREASDEVVGRGQRRQLAVGQGGATDLEQPLGLVVSDGGQAAAPAGGEDDYTVLETLGTPAEFDFEPRDHVELGRMLGAIDLDRGAKVSGARFYFLTGVGAELEFALINLANETARSPTEATAAVYESAAHQAREVVTDLESGKKRRAGAPRKRSTARTKRR